MDLTQQMERMLKAFDDFDLDDKYMRRLAVKPLYDFYQILLLELGVTHCHLLRATLGKYHLAARWREVSHFLEFIDGESNVWDQTIKSLQKMRGSNEHNDYHEPKKQALLAVRKKAPEFMEWVLATSTEYLRQSKGFSFIDRYVWLSHSYSRRTSYIKHRYGENTPLLVREDLPAKETNPYLNLVPMREGIQERLSALRSVHDLTGEDLDRLVALIREVERIDAREDAYVRFRFCPKCGGRISDTQQSFGGCSADPTPYEISYRVGCDTCDFELMSETVNV